MINVLIPITSNVESYKKIIDSLGQLNEVRVLIGIVSSLKNKIDFVAENTDVFEFEDGSKKEEIINGMQSKIPADGALMILRRPITIEEFYSFAKRKEDIVVIKKKRSKVGNFFFNLWQKILKSVLGLKLYDGDYGAIMFNDVVASVSNQSNDLSFTSRADRWRGVNTSSVEVKGESPRTEIDKKNIAISSVVGALMLVLGVTVTLLVALLTKVSTMGGLLLFCLDAICVCVFFVMMVMVGFGCKVGKKHFKSAFEIINKSNFVDTIDDEDEFQDDLLVKENKIGVENEEN